MIIFDLRDVGNRIKKRRIELGITQQYVYEKLNISQNHMSRIENGHVGMSYELLLELCEMLDVSADYLLTGRIGNNTYFEFIDKYNKLDEKQREYINKHIDLFIESDLK